MRGYRGIDQIAAQHPEPRQRSLLVRPGEPAVADDISDQDRSDLPRFRHGVASGLGDAIMNSARLGLGRSRDLNKAALASDWLSKERRRELARRA